jgi:hypothetical protein
MASTLHSHQALAFFIQLTPNSLNRFSHNFKVTEQGSYMIWRFPNLLRHDAPVRRKTSPKSPFLKHFIWSDHCMHYQPCKDLYTGRTLAHKSICCLKLWNAITFTKRTVGGRPWRIQQPSPSVQLAGINLTLPSKLNKEHHSSTQYHSYFSWNLSKRTWG